MSEFAPDITVVTKADKQIRMRSLTQLLPESFQLNKEGVTEFPAGESGDTPEEPDDPQAQEEAEEETEEKTESIPAEG